MSLKPRHNYICYERYVSEAEWGSRNGNQGIAKSNYRIALNYFLKAINNEELKAGKDSFAIQLGFKRLGKLREQIHNTKIGLESKIEA